MTKIFIVLQLVCSLVLAVMVVTLVQHQDPLKEKLESQRIGLYAAQAGLAKEQGEHEKTRQELLRKSQELTALGQKNTDEVTRLNGVVAQMKIEIAGLESKNTTAVNSVAGLTATADALSRQLEAMRVENSRLVPENVSLIGKNADLQRANNEVETKLRLAEQSIRKLQEQIAAYDAAPKAGASAGAADVNTVSVLNPQTPAQVNAKITAVTNTPGRILLGLPLGARDGMRTGTLLLVYRDQSYIADAVVEKVTPDECVAAVDPSKVKQGETVKAGDMVISGTAK